MTAGKRCMYTLAILLGAFTVTTLNAHRPPDRLALPLATIPATLAGWHSVGDEQIDPFVLENLRPSDYIARQYGDHERRLGMFVAFYGAQHAGEGIHSPQNCLPGSGWSIESRTRIPITVENKSQDINRCIIRKGAAKLLLLYWYQSKDRIVADEYTGKILLVRDAVLARPRGSAIVRLTLPDRTSERNDAVAFASQLATSIQRCFGYSQ